MPLFFACEKQIDVTVPSSGPKLVVDGWFTDEPGEQGMERLQTVRLSMSIPYFSTEKYSLVKDAQVILKDTRGNQYNMKYVIPKFYDPSQGKYTFDTSKGRYEIRKNLELSISYQLYIKLADGTEYESETQMVHSYLQTPRIYSEYKEADDDRFDKDGNYIGFEPKYIKSQENYFIWQLFQINEYDIGNGKMGRNENSFSDYLFGSSVYTNLEESDTFFDHVTNLGEKYFIKQFVVSKKVYDYMRLAEQQRDNEGTQFSPPPAPLRSNIKKVGGKNIDDNALGLFLISSVQRSEVLVISKSK